MKSKLVGFREKIGESVRMSSLDASKRVCFNSSPTRYDGCDNASVVCRRGVDCNRLLPIFSWIGVILLFVLDAAIIYRIVVVFIVVVFFFQYRTNRSEIANP